MSSPFRYIEINFFKKKGDDQCDDKENKTAGFVDVFHACLIESLHQKYFYPFYSFRKFPIASQSISSPVPGIANDERANCISYPPKR